MTALDVIHLIGSVSATTLVIAALPIMKALVSLRHSVDSLRAEIYRDYLTRADYERDRDRQASILTFRERK